MKKYLLILSVFLVTSFLNAQELEQYNSYDRYTYIDNLDSRIVPKKFTEIYYSKIDESDFNILEQRIDTLNKVRSVYVYTKKARKGYLSVNKKISDIIQKNKYDIDRLTLVYILNEESVSTKKQIEKLLTLKENNIIGLDANMDDEFM
ncbi:MAG: hypothetical protein E6767_09840 [Dysgonomonas sp.]|nr:hypothetical protein [Dysgonomonas sp.]